MPAVQAQTESCTRRTIAVTVLDKNGEPVPGLTAADFRAEFRKQSIKVTSAKPHAGAVRIVVMFDHSGSIDSAQGLWQMALKAMGDLYAKGPSDIQLALIIFSDTVDRTFGFDKNRNAAMEAMQAFAEVNKRGKGQTALFDAMLEGIGLIQPPQPGDVIYLISDGADTSSRARYSEVEEKLLALGIRVFAFPLFRLLPSRNLSFEEADSISQFVALVENTGGGFFQFDHPPISPSAEGARLYRQMANVYELDLELPMEVDKRRVWKLELVRARELKRPQLGYQRYLMPCPVASPQP